MGLSVVLARAFFFFFFYVLGLRTTFVLLWHHWKALELSFNLVMKLRVGGE